MRTFAYDVDAIPFDGLKLTKRCVVYFEAKQNYRCIPPCSLPRCADLSCTEAGVTFISQFSFMYYTGSSRDARLAEFTKVAGGDC
jgi:hypothetical protein